MSMRQECIDLVSDTMGRKISQEEGDAIISNIKAEMSRLRRDDPAKWSTMTLDERVREAGRIVAERAVEDAKRKFANTVKAALRQDERVRDMKRLANEEDIHAYAAVAKIMQDTYRKGRGIQNEYLTSMFDTLNGIKSKYFGFVENADDVRAFVMEAFGQSSGNARARAAWNAWSQTADAMRVRANNAGADIGRLDYGYIPQSHDWWKVRRAGKEQWVRDIFPLMDRERFIGIDGERLTDEEIRQVLGASFDDIVTSGVPDGEITEIAANLPKLNAKRFQKYPHRVLHFASPEGFLQYEAKYGKGSLTASLIGHVAKMSNNIALLESFGPRPSMTYQFLKGIAEASATNARMRETSWKLLTKWSDYHGLTGANIDEIWNVLTGVASHAAVNSEGVAQFMAGWRNLEVAGKLGKAFISSFSDIPTYFVATGFCRLGFADGFKFFMRAYGSDWKDYAARAGFIADSIASDFVRWGSDNIGQGWTAKMAQATMKASFLNAFTDATRRAFSLNMMASFAKLIEKDWASLDAYDRARLQDGGISEREFELLRQAGTEEHNGIKFLTIRQIKDLEARLTDADADEVAQLPGKYLGFIINESEMASLGPDLITRAEATRGAQRGTIKGEFFRALFMFKSFPISMMERHFRRASFLWDHGGKGESVAYCGAILVATTAFGALSVQVQNLLNGKDMQDVFSKEFWLTAMAKGGGLGFLGDYIANGLSEDARFGAMSGLTNFAGPMVGTAVETADLVTSTLGSAIYDRETKPAARALRLVRSHMPFLNMWYASTVIDREVMNDLQEYLSPGYLQRLESRQRRSTGQQYWWGLGESLPERSPTMADQPIRR